jgi:hypothetical protein
LMGRGEGFWGGGEAVNVVFSPQNRALGGGAVGGRLTGECALNRLCAVRLAVAHDLQIIKS